MFGLSCRYTRHLTEDAIVRLQDGELRGRQAKRARAHLEACWSCRNRANQIEQTVLLFVEGRDRLLEKIGPPPGGMRLFQLRLSRQSTARSGAQFSSGTLLARRVAGFLLQPRMATVLVSAAALVFWISTSRHVPAASAGEVLQRADNSETAAARAVKVPVVHQKLEVSSNGETVEWELWRAAARDKFRDHWSHSSGVSRELRAVYAKNKLDGKRPLSAGEYSAWRDSLRDKKERVSERPGGFINIETYSDGAAVPGEIQRASLLLRKSDLHPIAESLEVASAAGPDREFYIREISYRIVPFETIAASIFAAPESLPPPAPAPARPPAGPAAEAPAEPEVLESQIQQAEVRLREAIHGVAADITENPEIRREGESIQLRLFVRTVQRKQGILAAVDGIPFVKAEINDLEELASEPPLHAGAESTRTEWVPGVQSEPPLYQALIEFFGTEQLAGDYLKQVRDDGRLLSLAAEALRRLAERYPDDEFARLSPESQAGLNGIATDYVETIQARCSDFLNLLSAVLDPMLAKYGIPPAEDRVSRAKVRSSWRQTGSALAAEIEQLQETFLRLFIVYNSGKPVQLTPQELLQECAGIRARLRDQVKTLE